MHAVPEETNRVRWWEVAAAGVAAQAVTYGFARYGYGLFLPEIRDAFDLSVATLGLIGSAGYAAYLGALLLVGALVARTGPRPMIVAAEIIAAAGMVLVGLAQDTWMLVTGIVVAGTTPALAWTPFSDAVDRSVAAPSRARVLALIPTGTAFGVIVAGPLALLAGSGGWRYAWLAFAMSALLAACYAALRLPAGTGPGAAAARGRARLGPRWFLRRAAVPLYLTAGSYGLAGAVYWSFAVAAVSGAAGGGGNAVGPLFWTVMGVAGTAGLLTGPFIARYGLRRAHALLFTALAVAIALLGIAPGERVAAFASAVLYGPAFMAVSGMLALWSHRVFSERPSTGFTAVVVFLGVGTIIGPGAFGVVAAAYGLPAMFLLTATLAAVTPLAGPAIAGGAGPVRVRGGCVRRTRGRRRRWGPLSGTPPR